MNKNDDFKDLEQEMKSFPKLQLDKSKQQQIHQNIMDVADKLEQKQKRGDIMSKIFVGLSSVAVLVLGIGLAFSFTGNNEPKQNVTDPGSEEVVPDPNDQEKLPEEEPEQEEPDDEGEDQEEVTVTDVYSEYEEVLTGDLIKVEGFITNDEGITTTYVSLDPNTLRQFIDGLKVTKIKPTDEVGDSYGYRTIKLYDQYDILPNDGIEDYDNRNVLSLYFDDKGNVEINKEYYVIQESGLDKFTDQFFIEENIYHVNKNDKPGQLYESSRWIVEYLKDRDFEKIAEYVHPTKGLLFSPYIYIQEDAQVFSAEEVVTLLEDPTVYQWGFQDGSGFPIEMTASEYFEIYVFNKDYTNSNQFRIDEMVSRGNSINNIKEVFPDSFVVEFFVKGTEHYGDMDWGSLNLVYEMDNDGVLRLVAIVHDQWTI
ncbi:hypothetical protein GCM10008967_20530 [Bacillus carboniphilus]|uniref:PKD domain-containing protein n=1 Tax=Bacillus carboniphilus TaxID=86663 RepID=A0ABN0W9I5_9BACI